MNYFQYNSVLYDEDNKAFSGINFFVPDFTLYESKYIFYKVNIKTQYRPDIIAYEVYGNEDLSWVIDEINNATHPSFYTKDKKIYILPSNYLIGLGII